VACEADGDVELFAQAICIALRGERKPSAVSAVRA
jgi:hypothetical protein